MYSNVYFWLGEFGLILTAISSAVFMHRFRTDKYIDILPFLFALVMALTMLVRPAIVTINNTIPPEPYLFRLAVGIVFARRAFVWRSMSLLGDKQMMDKIWRYMVLAAMMFLFWLGYKLRNK